MGEFIDAVSQRSRSAPGVPLEEWFPSWPRTEPRHTANAAEFACPRSSDFTNASLFQIQVSRSAVFQ